MGDKSPKAKQRGQKQKGAAEAKGAANLKARQEGYSRSAQAGGKIPPKGKK